MTVGRCSELPSTLRFRTTTLASFITLSVHICVQTMRACSESIGSIYRLLFFCKQCDFNVSLIVNDSKTRRFQQYTDNNVDLLSTMSRERLTLGPCATVNQQQPWMCMANHMLSRYIRLLKSYLLITQFYVKIIYMPKCPSTESRA